MKGGSTVTQRDRTILATRLIAAGDSHTLGVKSDGTVIAAGKNRNGQCDVGNWTNIMAVAAGNDFSVGILRDGTAITCGKKHSNSRHIRGWKNVVAASAGAEDIIGLTADGTAIFSSNSSLAEWIWPNILSVEASGYSTLLGVTKARGVVVGGCSDPRFSSYIMNWTDIMAIASGSTHIVGLRSNGTVVAIWDDRYNFGQCNTDGWRNIIAIAAGMDHTVGLKADGTVVAVGANSNGACNVAGWRNIIAIAAGMHHTVGLKSDGTLIAVGENKRGQCNVADWKLF